MGRLLWHAMLLKHHVLFTSLHKSTADAAHTCIARTGLVSAQAPSPGLFAHCRLSLRVPGLTVYARGADALRGPHGSELACAGAGVEAVQAWAAAARALQPGNCCCAACCSAGNSRQNLGSLLLYLLACMQLACR